MEKKEFQKLFKEQTEEIREENLRHQKMLLEEFQSRIKPIGEMQVEHSKKFDTIFDTLVAHSKQLEKLDPIMEMTAINTENIELIKSMLKRKIDVEEHEALIKRVVVLEKKLRIY